MNNLSHIWQSHRQTISILVMVFLLAFVGVNQSWVLALSIFNLCLISAIMALGVNIQWGYAGLFNIGIMGFAALGGLSVVLISAPSVPMAVSAGGMKILFALCLLLLSIVLSVYLSKHKYNKGWVVLSLVAGYFSMRYFYVDAAQAIEAVNPSKTGYLGGLGLPVPLAWLAGGLLAAGAAWLIGKITLGLRSDYLAIASFGIAEIVLYIIKNEDWIARGVKNVTGLPRPVPLEIDLQQSPWFEEMVVWFNQSSLSLLTEVEKTKALGILLREYSVVFVKLCYSGLFLAILVALIVMANLAFDSPWGRKVRAIRDNETAASAMGKNVKRQHLQIFIIGSAIVGIAGALLVTYTGQFTPNSYQSLRFTFLIWVMVIVGGSGNNFGSVIGAFFIWFFWVESTPMGLWLAETVQNFAGADNGVSAFLQERAHFLRYIFMGLIMLLVLRFAPGGILPEKDKKL
ncbi:branched-chain amino acid ABC transporter permease [Bathymodiolus heckerae thiotrophic gill symbiont]|uniref:branched-chain amino acid ABC transporter permease n=1 Tax=Bathymodiolus heckerae thiotrophic gill symbiont TaxID=1052212 RepID=UPI0010FE073C|nr:branched-chain amino acid ABC transporter permease [Bathymodiolus heckerae thiotrophic gill symbiont]